MSQTGKLLEGYGDNHAEVARNGMLGVARAKKFNKLPKDQKRQQVVALVNSWITALSTQREEIADWLVSKLK